MAVPGETTCREVAPCGDGPWGAAPIDAATEFVDATFTGASDGTPAAPWTSIQAAVDAAAPDAVIAIAEGSYAENVHIQDKPVRLWGRCPALVEIVGNSGALTAVLVTSNAHGTEVHDLAISGATSGFGVSGSTDVLASRLWIHDTAGRGIDVEDDLGSTTFTLEGSLVEGAREIGAFLAGVEATIVESTVRGTRADGAGKFGDGVSIGINEETATASTVAIRGSVFEANLDYGLFVEGASATIEATLVRDTQPRPDDQLYGRGIGIQSAPGGVRGSATVRSSVVERSHDIGIFVMESDVTIDATVVRDTLPRPVDKGGGRGLDVQNRDDGVDGAVVVMERSLVERSLEHGVAVFGSTFTLASSIVRDTESNQSEGRFGRGVNVQSDPLTTMRSTASIVASVLARNHDCGAFVAASDLTVDGSLVIGTLPRDSGTFGDGLAAVAEGGPATARITGSSFVDNARAGVTAFGAAFPLGGSTFECNPIALNGEAYQGPFTIEDLGGNICGCDGEQEPCKVSTSGLAPPEPVPPR
jgi:nitrous oxidase accessory protein NosD